MGVFDNIAWALRHCRKRLFESLLIVLAIGLGVAVIVAILALIFYVRAELLKSYEWEEMRTFRVYSAAFVTMSTGQEPILSIVQERPAEPLQVPLSELTALQDSLPSGMHVFAELSMVFPSPLLPKPTPESEGTFETQYEVLGPVRITAPGSTPLAVTEGAVVITKDALGVTEATQDDGVDEASAEQAPGVVSRIELVEVKNTTLQELLSWREQYEYIEVVGATLSYFEFKQYQIAQGNMFVDNDYTSGSRVMILSDRLANRIFGDTNPIGMTVPLFDQVTQQEIPYTVIGVFAPFDSEDTYINERYLAFIPYTAMPDNRIRTAGEEIVVDNFMIGVDKGIDLAKAAEIIQNEIKQRYGELGTVMSNYLSMSSVSSNAYSLYIIIAVFACLGLVIAVINILNLMLARVLRRTKSIGLSIALGSTKGAVFRQFMLEAVMLGLTGAVIGIGLGFVLLNGVIISLIRTAVPFGLEIVAAGCGLGLLVSLLFGVYPAYQGAAVDPVDALRSE